MVLLDQSAANLMAGNSIIFYPPAATTETSWKHVEANFGWLETKFGFKAPTSNRHEVTTFVALDAAVVAILVVRRVMECLLSLVGSLL